MADFQRSAPDAKGHLRKGPGLWVKLRLDPFLLILIFAIMSFGLLVLYSGSGASDAAVQRQSIRYGILRRRWWQRFCNRLRQK